MSDDTPHSAEESQSLPSEGWQEFEKLVAELHRKVAPGADVRHNQHIIGRSQRSRQLDITITQHVGLYPTLIVIECRKYQRPVSIDKVEAFASKLEDVGASHGVIVSNAGFDAGAKAVAALKRITLMTYRGATELDWHQATAAAAWLTLTVTQNQLKEVGIKLEGGGPAPCNGDSLTCEADGTPSISVQEIARDLVKQVDLGHRPQEWNLEMAPDPPLYVMLDGRPCQIGTFTATCRVRAFEYIINISLADGHILTDSITGERRYQELISKPWDIHQILASPPNRELTAVEFDELMANRRTLAVLNPNALKRFMRVVISPKLQEQPPEAPAGGLIQS